MYRINSTWTSFDIDLKNLKQVLLKTNTGSVSGEIPNIETRYFKLPFIGMYSEVTQNKIAKNLEKIRQKCQS